MADAMLKEEPQGLQFDQQFLNDTLDFWSGRKTGHLNWQAFNEPEYSNDPVRGGEHWSNMIIRNALYYLITKETEAVKQHIPEISDYLPPSLAHGDLGPGESVAQKQKTLPAHRALKDSTSFAAIDINNDFAGTAATLIQTEIGTPSRFIVGNFLSENLNIFPNQRAIYTLFGGLLCNFGRDTGRSPEDILTETFNGLAKNMKPGDYLAITQDTNQIEEALLEAYSHPDMALYVLSVLHKMKRDLPTENFDPEAFEFVANWNKTENLLSLNIRLKENYPPQSFKINGEPFSVGHDKPFSVVNSYKFDPELFIAAAEAAGFVSEKLLQSKNNPIATHLFQYKPAV